MDCFRWAAENHDEIMDEMVATLGFSRRGARIESGIRGAISRGEHKSDFRTVVAQDVIRRTDTHPRQMCCNYSGVAGW